MSVVDTIIAHILELEISLYHASARLEARTDPEALHDLRINVRRLRSLLKPLRGKDGVNELDGAAAAVGQLTTPVRDLEVLIDELRSRGLSEAADTREATLASHYSEIVHSPELQQLFTCIDAWPADFRVAQRAGELRRLDKLLGKRLRRQMVRLQSALADRQHDPHRIRLLVKHNRYAADAYPQHSPISPEAAVTLKAMQASLGAWHDRYQWCLKAAQEPDLEPLQLQWQSEASAALAQAEGKLLAFAELLQALGGDKTNGPLPVSV
jgi:CHAD domain-containing protein